MMFRQAFVSAALVAALAIPAAGTPGNHGKGKGGGPGPVDCEAARCAMQDAIANCPCDTATNHGSYVHCVVRAVKDAARAHTIANRCKGKIVRCAAHSSCGKPDKVTCIMPGHCDVSAGHCVGADTACTTDSECTGAERCKIRSTDDCQTAGGTPGPAGSCCAACAGSPSAAFLD